MVYLPKTLIILGGGVIASEYASIFQALDVKVTMIDKYHQPLGFLDQDLTDKFVRAFELSGGTWKGNTTVKKAYWNGEQVAVDIDNEATCYAEKLLCAVGRTANTKELMLENISLSLNEKGLISVNEQLQTDIDSVFAVGDVIGPPALASTSMKQGRRAVLNAYQKTQGKMAQMIPTGIYSIPELSAIGMSEKLAREHFGDVIVGIAQFEEIARGQIAGTPDGILKIVCDGDGQRILGVMIIGEGATELIHIGQMVMISEANVDIFVESIFNFPTLAEAYRVAALSVIGQRQQHRDKY